MLPFVALITQVSDARRTNLPWHQTDRDPGTESETVPLDTQSGTTSPLTCPNGATYYKHLGMVTSAEYYVNMAGVPVEKACIWGTDGTDEGNWAPVVFGVGTDASGATWLSIQTTRQNDPINYEELNYTVALQGDFGGTNACFYVNVDSVGYYCSKGTPSSYSPSDCVSYNPSTHPVPGCTVSDLSHRTKEMLTRNRSN